MTSSISYKTQIHDRRDLERLCEVSKDIYNYTVPVLYQAVTLRVGEEGDCYDFDVEPLLRTCSTTNGCLRYVKHLHLTTDFHHKLEPRCGHMNLDYPDLRDLEEPLKPLFDRLDDNSLTSFR